MHGRNNIKFLKRNWQRDNVIFIGIEIHCHRCGLLDVDLLFFHINVMRSLESIEQNVVCISCSCCQYLVSEIHDKSTGLLLTTNT
jgi:hypothetical protein